MPDTQPTAPWMPDLGDGTYKNPVLYADYSDPDAVRDGDDYWLTASSFNCTPGLPILHSKDLVNWTLVNHAIKNNPDPRKVFATYRGGEGVWAPAIRKHDGRFWIFFPLPDEGIYVTTATDPRGEWSEPWCLLEGKGYIDPCPLWDSDGQAYLVHAYANSRIGIKHRLRVVPMSPDGKKILGDGKVVFDEPIRHPTCEGPKWEKRDGYYYILAPAGGVATGWQLVLRSKNVYGPYEEKIVLEQGKSPINGPHQGALVDTPTGEWWFLHFQDDGLYGRVVHLQPVQWKDGWPLMGVDADGNGVGEPVLTHKKPNLPTQPIAVPATSDEFDAATLGLQWQWNANHPATGWHTLGNGKLRLNAIASDLGLLHAPNALCQKFPARSFTAETELHVAGDDANAQAGLVILGLKHAALLIHQKDGQRVISVVVNDEIKATDPLPSDTAKLRVTVADGGLCTFAFARPGDANFTPIGEAFQATEGHWIGARVGLVCRTKGTANSNAYVDAAYFRVK
ncbi:MAG: glycoside hydrolase 43 family protein [Tepidisphaeraceae bacterium]